MFLNNTVSDRFPYSLILLLMVIVFCFYPMVSYTQNVQVLFSQEKYVEAIKQADVLLKVDALNVELNIIKAKAYQQILQYQKSIEALTVVLKKDSTNLKAQIDISFSYGKLKQYDKAIGFSENVLKYDTLNIQAANLLLGFYGITQQYKKIDNMLSRFIANDSTNMYLLNEYGDNLYKLNNFVKAKAVYEKLYSLTPNFFIALKISNLLILEKDYKKAINFSNIEYEREKHPTIMRNIAYCYYLLDSTILADSLFYISESQGDTSLFVRKYLGICSYKLEKYALACMYLEKACNIDTSDVLVLYYYGSSLVRNYNWDLGIVYLNKALALTLPNPNMIKPIYIELAQASLQKTQFDKAVDYYKQASAYANEPSKIMFNIAEVYDYDIKDKNKAYKCYTDIYKKLNGIPLSRQDSSVLIATKYRIKTLLTEIKEKK